MKKIVFTICLSLVAILTTGGLVLSCLASEPSAPLASTNAATDSIAAPSTRSLGEADLKELLTVALQREHVRDRGELELRFTRSWSPVVVPAGETTLNILELPSTGVSPNFIVRFELRAAGQVIGTWQAPVQAHVWREIWVARSPLKRGQLLSEADRVKERRDVLSLRDTCLEDVPNESLYEIAEVLSAGAPLYVNSVKLRRLVRRGQVAEAVVQDGAMSVSLKVEILEDGVRGQFIRVRNPQSRREFRGKVENEQTVLVNL